MYLSCHYLPLKKRQWPPNVIHHGSNLVIWQATLKLDSVDGIILMGKPFTGGRKSRKVFYMEIDDFVMYWIDINSWWCHIVSQIWLIINSGNGLLFDVSTPLAEPMQSGLVVFICGQFLRKCSRYPSLLLICLFASPVHQQTWYKPWMFIMYSCLFDNEFETVSNLTMEQCKRQTIYMFYCVHSEFGVIIH